MERQFFSGNTLEQAILAAARHYGLDPSRVAYSVRDKKHGFLNIRRNVVIEVDPAAPELPEDARIESPAVPAGSENPPGRPRRAGFEDRPSNRASEPVSWRGDDSSWLGEEASDSEALEKAVEELSRVLGIGLETSIQQGEEGYEVELSSTDSDLLKEDRGRALVAIEHLLPRMMRGLSGLGVPVRVDTGGFREAHEEALRELALETAAEVRSESREKCMEPMNPADRRQVHLALADDPSVRTESEGQGFMKRVRVIPA